MSEGDIAIASLMQSDGKSKNRPVLLLRKMNVYNDFLACGISSKLKHYVKDFDEIVSSKDQDYLQSGLLQDSLIRLGFLGNLSTSEIKGSIGKISLARHKRLLKNLSDFLIKDF